MKIDDPIKCDQCKMSDYFIIKVTHTLRDTIQNFQCRVCNNTFQITKKKDEINTWS